MADKRQLTESERRAIARGIVAFSALLYAWKVADGVEFKRRARELARIGVSVKIASLNCGSAASTRPTR